MKVLQQLVQHFWLRGALTLEQAHYLVEHGLVRAADLDSYEPREQDQEADGDEEGAGVDSRAPVEVLLPDELDHREEALAAEAGAIRKGGKSTPKLPNLSSEQLGQRLEEILGARADSFSALAELAGPDHARSDGRKAAGVLRNLPEETFRRRFLAAVQARPGVLADLWECVDPKPFHDFLDEPGVKGRPVRAFGVILRSNTPAAWGSAAWVLQIPAVQAVAHLLEVRRRLLAAVLWLYENHRGRLARCLQRPAHPAPSWDGLGFGMALVHNARARLANRAPAGFRLEKRLTADGWRDAWTTAMGLDGASVTPYFVHCFGGAQELTDSKCDAFAEREDVELVCPYDWKV